MALGRPADAVEAYQAALGFDEYKGRGKALANLGQAYVALGEYAEAVKSFEKATQLHGHTLSPAALAAYETALEQVRPAEAEPGAEIEDGRWARLSRRAAQRSPMPRQRLISSPRS